MKLRVVALMCAIAAILGIRTLGAMSDVGDGKPGPKAIPEGAKVAGPDDSTPTAGYTVSALATAPAGRTCPSGWGYFDNPAMHYGLCYPAGWGFTDFTTAAPQSTIESKRLGSLRMLSPEGFPWKVGQSASDAVLERGVTDVELNLLQPGATLDGCSPTTQLRLANRTIRSCEEFLDSLGQPADSGDIHVLKIVVPLLQTPTLDAPLPDLTGSALLVIVRASVSEFNKEADLEWLIAKNIVPF
ncbi:MAG: hypothetical protein WDA27_13495 [Actinomycetota bacterium]